MISPGPWKDAGWCIYDAGGKKLVTNVGCDFGDLSLMAAAPEMLAALDEAEGYLSMSLGECDDDCECVLHGIRAALRKARGAQ